MPILTNFLSRCSSLECRLPSTIFTDAQGLGWIFTDIYASDTEHRLQYQQLGRLVFCLRDLDVVDQFGFNAYLAIRDSLASH